MFNFGAVFQDRAGGMLTGLDDVTFKALSWSAAGRGGPKAAEIEATGNRAALKSILMHWLGYGVQVTTPSAGACWWGYVHEVSLTIDGVEIVSSLDALRNRVAVTYTALDGAVETAATTAWAEDAASQSEFDPFGVHSSRTLGWSSVPPKCGFSSLLPSVRRRRSGISAMSSCRKRLKLV